MRGERGAARDGAGTLAEQNLELVFLKADALFQVGDDGGDLGQSAFGAVGFEFGGDAAAQTPAEDRQTFAVGVGGAPGNFQFRVQFQKLEIVLRHLGDEGEADAAPGLLAGEELGAGGFVEAAHAPPQVNFPGGVQGRLERTGGGAVALGVAVAAGGVFSAVTVDIVAGLREELGTRLLGQGAGLLDAGGGDARCRNCWSGRDGSGW